jgi:enoyl-[acyl-carrier protein] reductase II
MKKLTPVRLLENEFSQSIFAADNFGVSQEDLTRLLGKGRAKKGMFEGDLSQVGLEIGQVTADFNTILPIKQTIKQIWEDFLVEK